MRLLCDQELADAVRGMFENQSDLRCAVAFWGPEMAALARSRRAKVVLDISMGGTSRNALRALGARKKRMPATVGDDVRVLDGLHAKIFLGEDAAIVGSANASVNALGRKGYAPKLREAGVLIDRMSDPEAFAQVEAAWNQYLKASRPIHPDDLDRAVRVPSSAAARDHAGSDGTPTRSILEAVTRRPEEFADTVFVFGDYGVDGNELAAGEAAYEETYGSKPRKDGRTHVCLIEDDKTIDGTMRGAAQVVTYWFGRSPGLYAYHDLVRVEHGEAGVTYFGRTGWPTVRKAIGLSGVGKDEVWKHDRKEAKALSKSEGEPSGGRFVVMSHAVLFETLEAQNVEP